MVAALDHPYIVHIDDFGMEEQASRAYLFMPFLGGGTLHDVLKKRHRPLEVEQVVSYVEQIGSALDYAHHRGVVHLDLKPQNLFVHEDGRLLLSDFGLAHLLKQEVMEGGTSLRYGTPHYMAPDHIHEQPEKQSDVYSLGVILYQMLVGRRPFEGSTPEAVFVKHVTEPPPPLQAWRPELPLELDEVVERALAKQVMKRYQSAGTLVVAFKDALVRAREQARKAEEEEQTPSHFSPSADTRIPHGLRLRHLSWRKAGKLLILALLILGVAGGLFATTRLSSAGPQEVAAANAQASATARTAADAYARFVATNGIMFGFDAQHSHANPYEQILNPKTVGGLTKKWAYQTGGRVDSSPAVAGGVVYVGSTDDNLYAFHLPGT
jgi:serine/threonine protein kinase